MDIGRLYDVARALTGALSRMDVVQAVFDHALVDLGASAVGLWLMETGAIRFIGGSGLTEQFGNRVGLIPADSDLPAAAVLRSREILTYRSVEERDRRWPSLTGVTTFSEGTAILPLLVHDRPLGCIHIGFPKVMDPDDFDLRFLRRLAQLTAAALDRAHLHDSERERQAFLLEASAVVAAADSFAETLHRLAAVAVPRLADLCVIDVLEGHEIRRAAAVHADPAVAHLVAELDERYTPNYESPHPAPLAMSERRSVWAPEIPDELLRAIARDERHLEIVRQLHYTSYISVPLISGGEALGAITLLSAGSGRRFGASDLALAEALAAQVVDVLVAARRHEREHDLAHVLQQLLLPERVPDMPGLEAAWRYLTAAPGAEAGGDFYDLIPLPQGRWGFVVGDVEGHDAAAAATMGQLRSAGRALSAQVADPGSLVDALRSSWDLLGFSRTATGLFGRIDPRTGEVVIASAGHPSPILVTPQGPATLLDIDTAPPLGTPAGAAAQVQMVLRPGETLFLYTDGLFDTPAVSIDESLTTLVRSLDASGCQPLEELCDQVIAAHATATGRPDDVAILALRRR